MQRLTEEPPRSQFASHFWSTLTIYCWLFSIVSALIPQLQIALISTAPIPTFYFRIGLPIIAALAIAARPKGARLAPAQITNAWVLYLFGILLSCLTILSSAKLPPAEFATFLLANNYLLLALPLFYMCPRILDLDALEKLLLATAPPLVTLGIAQFYLADAILPVAAPDGSFSITSWYFYGEVRAFSLFASPLDFAFYLALVSAIAAQRLRMNFLGLYCGALLLAAIVATYATYTRLSYLFVTQVLLVSWALRVVRRPISRAAWLMLPILLLATTLVAVEILPMLAASRDTGNLLADDSLLMRKGHWEDALSAWLSGGPTTFLFGTGLTQAASNADFIVDNTILNFALNIGAVGAVTATLLLYRVWMGLRDHQAFQSPLVLAIAAVWSTWLSTSAYNTTHVQYLLLVIPVVLGTRKIAQA